MAPVPAGKDIKIISVSSGKVLQADGSAVGQSWNKDEHDAHQRWRLAPVHEAGHQYQIENVGNGMILAVSAGSQERGARVLLQKDKDGPHGRWRLIPMADNEYAIMNVHSNQAMDLWGASADDETPIAQFDYWHGPQQRWRLITPDTTARTRAVLTLVRNEHVFLPIWLRYYRKFFKPEDMYILDHQSTDGSTEGCDFVRIRVPQETFGTAWQRDLIQRHQHELSDRYDVVLYTDVDEIVAPDPRYCDLGEYIDHFSRDFVTCQGYEVLHMNEEEPPLDHTRQILPQRSTWYHNPMYSKSLLTRVPMLWHGGFHERFDRKQNHDPNLYLIHLHRMDYDLCLARHQERRRFPRAEPDLRLGWGYQNRITDPAKFSHWFYHDSSGGGPIKPEKIPAHWQEIV